jgi:hypothetical protein
MHPIRLSEQAKATATITTTAEDGSGRLGVLEGTRDLSISEPQEDELEGSGTFLFQSSGIISCGEETLVDSKGSLPQRRRQSIPVSSKEVMKTISDGASSYLSTKPNPSSTSKIVDQALNVVQRQGSTSSNDNDHSNMVEMHHSSQCSCDNTDHSASTNTTAQSTVDSSSHRSSPTHTNNQRKADPPQEAEPNCIAPALRKIAKKRRKEPGKDGIERSSFHHTKSSKEYLRKAQEALRMQQQQQGQTDEASNNNSKIFDLSKGLDGDSMHSPRTNFRILSQGTSLSSGVMVPPFARSQSCGSVLSNSKSFENSGTRDTNSNPYGYEDPDAAIAKNKLTPSAPPSGGENPYGYEDPDANAASSTWAEPRRMGPARRRGSVTKYSLQAAHAAQKATERIMKLQGLNWGGTVGSNVRNVAGQREESPVRRSMTPTGRRRTPRDMGTGDHSQPMAPPVRRRSIPMDALDMKNSSHHDTRTADADAAMDASERLTDAYSCGDVSMVGNSVQTSAESNPYGYEDTEVSTSTTEPLTASNPYGYEYWDKLPQQPRRHPCARRRGSVTKFSLEAAQTVASSEEAPVVPLVETGPDPSLPNGGDFVMALKPPAESRSKCLAPRSRRRDVDFEMNMGSQLPNCNNSGGSEEGFSPRRSAPRRTGSARSASSRHLARFSAPSRSDSFLSHGSTGSFEDDVDSLAPDMESLCSIHDRDLGTDFDLGGAAPPMSPLTPGLNHGNKSKSLGRSHSNKSDGGSGLDSFLLEHRKSLSERSNFPVVSIPVNNDFAILPYPTGNTDARSSARMPAPIRRAPSHSTSGFKSTQHGCSPSGVEGNDV